MGVEFILHSDHEAIKFIQGQHKLNPCHAEWVEYLHAFMIHHKVSQSNKGTDALTMPMVCFISMRGFFSKEPSFTYLKVGLGNC